MTLSTRRGFLQTAVAASAGLALAPVPLPAADPIQRTSKVPLRLSIAAYSYRKYLDLKLKPKPPMTLDDYVDLAAEIGFDAVEPTAYYFADTSPEYLARLKGRCARLGLDVSGSAVGNDFCVTDPAKLKEQISHVKKWTEYCSLLGAKTLRIFAGRVVKGDTEEQARVRCAEAIAECCDHAAKYGVFMALENHGGIVETCDQMMALVSMIKHPWFGVNLDSGNFHTPDPYGDLQRLAPYAVNVQLKTEISRGPKSKKEESDLKRLVGMLRDANYRGYVVLEYEAAEDPKTAVPRYAAQLRQLLDGRS